MKSKWFVCVQTLPLCVNVSRLTGGGLLTATKHCSFHCGLFVASISGGSQWLRSEPAVTSDWWNMKASQRRHFLWKVNAYRSGNEMLKISLNNWSSKTYNYTILLGRITFTTQLC